MPARIRSSPEPSPLFRDGAKVKPIIKHRPSLPPAPVSFDPEKHLVYQAPTKVRSMTDVGYPEGTGISPVAISEGFNLFSREAVELMRVEAFSDRAWDECFFVASNSTACMIRGHCPKSVT